IPCCIGSVPAFLDRRARKRCPDSPRSAASRRNSMDAAHRNAFKPSRSQEWTRERVERLSKQDIEQLRANADRLGETGVVTVCDEALQARPTSAGGRGAARRAGSKHLISRAKAFQARGIYLPEAANSWSGVRKADGMVVMSLWASSVVSGPKGCSCVIWRPRRAVSTCPKPPTAGAGCAKPTAWW